MFTENNQNNGGAGGDYILPQNNQDNKKSIKIDLDKKYISLLQEQINTFRETEINQAIRHSYEWYNTTPQPYMRILFPSCPLKLAWRDQTFGWASRGIWCNRHLKRLLAIHIYDSQFSSFAGSFFQWQLQQ